MCRCTYLSHCIPVVVLAFLRVKSAANGGPASVNFAAVVSVKVSAPVLHIKIPLAFLNEDRCFLVADIPADIFKIISGGWLINLQCEILAAEPITIIAAITHLSSLTYWFL